MTRVLTENEIKNRNIDNYLSAISSTIHDHFNKRSIKAKLDKIANITEIPKGA